MLNIVKNTTIVNVYYGYDNEREVKIMDSYIGKRESNINENKMGFSLFIFIASKIY